MKQMILIFDPEQGYTVSNNRVVTAVSSFIDVYEKEGYFKSAYGNFNIIEEFMRQCVTRNIPLDCIKIVYRVAGVDKAIETTATEAV
jgi:hypothetical protein